jgi:hypothetical protein
VPKFTPLQRRANTEFDDAVQVLKNSRSFLGIEFPKNSKRDGEFLWIMGLVHPLFSVLAKPIGQYKVAGLDCVLPEDLTSASWSKFSEMWMIDASMQNALRNIKGSLVAIGTRTLHGNYIDCAVFVLSHERTELFSAALAMLRQYCERNDIKPSEFILHDKDDAIRSSVMSLANPTAKSRLCYSHLLNALVKHFERNVKANETKKSARVQLVSKLSDEQIGMIKDAVLTARGSDNADQARNAFVATLHLCGIADDEVRMLC